MEQEEVQRLFSYGTEVYSAEGDKVGRVIGTYATYVVVERGIFFPTDYYIPIDAFDQFDGERARLNVTKENALHSGWDFEPERPDEGVAPQTEDFDASGTAGYAAARDEMSSGMTPGAAADAAAAMGLTGHMGESETTPGLGGDLTEDRPEPANPGE